MAAALWKTSTANAFNTTLNGAINNTDTSIILTTATGLQYPGVICIDRVDGLGAATATKREYVSFTGITSSTLTGCTRGIGGSTAQSHSSGATVEENFSISHWNDLVTFLQVEHTATGRHILTSPVIRAYDGWIDANETWTYASASTITVPSGAASKYQIRDKIKWTQTTVKYGVIVAVADTLLTIAVNADYVVTDAAISANYYSHEATPMGYPKIFNNTDISLADALNSNLAVPAGTEFVRLSGGGASATIGGIVAGVNGQRLILEIYTGGSVSFLGENASSTATNRIFMGGLTTVVVSNLGAIELIYSTATARWIIISKD